MIRQNVGAGFTPAQMKTPQHKNILGNRKGCPYNYTTDLMIWQNVGAGFTPAQMKTPTAQKYVGQPQGLPLQLYHRFNDMAKCRGRVYPCPNENPKPLITPPT